MKLAERLNRLTIYKNVLCAPVAGELARAVASAAPEAVCGAFAAAAEAGFAQNISAAVANAVIFDDNAYTRAMSAGEEIPARVLDAVKFDLETLYILSRVLSGEIIPGDVYLPEWETGESPPPLNKGPWQNCLGSLSEFYAGNGAGVFAKYAAFMWKDELLPVESPDPIRFADLKGYDRERGQLITNTELFLRGFPANNILLYGDKGTGKSAAVHALVNEYRAQGLRVIEIPKEYLNSLPVLTSQLKKQSLKFILFIDDLTFSESGSEFAALKAILEGSLEITPENCLIYATSNRRHLIRESSADRDGSEMHAADSLQEMHSLSDRFGLIITFLKPHRDEYLDIVKRLAQAQGITIPEGELFEGAERWALMRGGRSPRAAVQYLRTIAR